MPRAHTSSAGAARRAAALILLLLPACKGESASRPPVTPLPTPAKQESTDSRRTPRGLGGNPALGSSEALNPAPFTLQDRYLEAARQGDLATLEKALQRGVSIDAKDDLGRSALLLTVSDAGSLEALRFLEEKGAAVDEPDLAGRTPVSWAAGAGRLDLVTELAARGAKTDRPDRQGRTPLFHAVLEDRREVAVVLLDAGAEVDTPDQFGDTPLLMACAKGFGRTATLLLQRGADPGHKNQEGHTARDRAAAGAEICQASGAGEQGAGVEPRTPGAADQPRR